MFKLADSDDVIFKLAGSDDALQIRSLKKLRFVVLQYI